MLLIVKSMGGGTWHADIRTETDRFLRYLYDQPERPTEDAIIEDWRADNGRQFKRWNKCTHLVITHSDVPNNSGQKTQPATPENK